MDAAGTVAEINARLREVLSEVEMDTLPDARVKMTATFADRGERVPYVDQDGDPLFDVEPDFMPDQLDLYTGRRLRCGRLRSPSKRAGTPRSRVGDLLGSPGEPRRTGVDL